MFIHKPLPFVTSFPEDINRAIMEYYPNKRMTRIRRKIDQKLRKQDVPKYKRPAMPQRNEKYPTIPEIALQLLSEFKENRSNIKIKSIFADALYGTQKFLDGASELFGGIQVISQIRSSRKLRHRGKEKHAEDFFRRILQFAKK